MITSKHVFYACILLISLIIPASFSFAGDPSAYKAEITQTESYLNSLKTGSARFAQTTHDGRRLIGTFYLNRPGKLRFEYDDPIEDFVVADGLFLYFYDAELQEQSNIPIGASLADFILRENIKLSGDVNITDVKRGDDLLQITIIQADDPQAGTLMLGFREDPFALKKWRVTDAAGLVTEVELFYLKTGMELDRNLFVFTHPEKGRKRLNE
jgi:outer membrane lipoprotein-sorting protein